MTKIFIASLVGAIIMFVWGFLAWDVLPIHANTFMYTPAQDAIMKTMADNNLESGVYTMPSAPTKEERQKIMMEMKGKSAASVYYIKEHEGMDMMMFVRGFLFDFIVLFAACILLANNMGGSFFSRWWMVMMIGVIMIFGYHLMYWNYMGHLWNFTRDFVLDTAIGWGICGLWLAWYLGKR
jgi:hypothetical protein